MEMLLPLCVCFRTKQSKTFTLTSLKKECGMQCLSQELKKVRHMSHQAEKGETCLTKLKHMSHQAEKVRDMSHQAEKGDQALATWKEH